MPFVGPVEDRLAIRELIESYSDAVTQRNADAWADCWAEDSRWCLPDLKGWAEIKGKSRIVEEWVKMMGHFHGPNGEPAICTFICLPGNMTINGDRATARSYTTEEFVDQKGATIHCKGQYDDKFVRRNGQWLFSERIWTLLPIADHMAIRG